MLRAPLHPPRSIRASGPGTACLNRGARSSGPVSSHVVLAASIDRRRLHRGLEAWSTLLSVILCSPPRSTVHQVQRLARHLGQIVWRIITSTSRPRSVRPLTNYQDQIRFRWCRAAARVKQRRHTKLRTVLVCRGGHQMRIARMPSFPLSMSTISARRLASRVTVGLWPVPTSTHLYPPNLKIDCLLLVWLMVRAPGPPPLAGGHRLLIVDTPPPAPARQHASITRRCAPGRRFILAGLGFLSSTVSAGGVIMYQCFC